MLWLHVPGFDRPKKETRYGDGQVITDFAFWLIIDWTFQAVHAAEQAHQALPGPERKAIVTDFLKRVLQQKNIALSDEEIDILIEAAVKEMNAAAGKLY